MGFDDSAHILFKLYISYVAEEYFKVLQQCQLCRMDYIPTENKIL